MLIRLLIPANYNRHKLRKLTSSVIDCDMNPYYPSAQNDFLNV